MELETELVGDNRQLLSTSRKYEAQLTSIKRETDKRGSPYLRLRFKLLDAPGQPIVSGACSLNPIVPGYRFHEWFRIFGNSNLYCGRDIVLKNYIGIKVVLTLKKVEKDGKICTNVNEIKSRI